MGEDPPNDSQTAQTTPAPDTLLAAKLSVPSTRQNIIPRPRLLQVLEDGLSRKVILLSAPAGYGKTSLVSTWARSAKMPVAWVTLDEADNDLTRFLTYLITALSTAVDGLGEGTLAMLRYQSTPDVETLTTPLINDLVSAETDMVIVLDDYHFIDIQPVHDTVAFIIDHMPAQIHMTISARSDPLLPMASLRGAGELIELRAADLRFTSDEARTFLAGAMGIELPEDTAGKLDRRVEGWAVGLQLAGLALKGRQDPRSFIEEFSGSHRYVLDFLTDEVMLQQPDEIRSFLLETSILESLNATLCDAVTAREDSLSLLAKLESSNLFLVALDDRREWYRYHHLFRDAMTYRLLEQVDGQSLRMLHQRAARWYSQHDFPDQALRHWMKAGDHAEASNLIEAVGMQVLAHGQLTKLQGWIDALPDELVRTRPWLCIQYAWILNLMGQLDQMELYLQEAERSLPQGEPDSARSMRGYIATIRAGAARKQNNAQAAIGYLQEGLDNLAEDDELVRSSAHFNLGSTYLDMGDVRKGERDLRLALQGAKSVNHIYTLIAGRSYLADAFMLQGQLHRAVRTYEQAIEHGSARNDGKPMPLTGYAHSGLGQVLYEQNLLDDAERHLGLALDLSEHLRDWTIVRRSLPTLARLQQATGRADQAWASWEKALDLAGQYGDRLGVDYLEAYRARMWLDQNAEKSGSGGFDSACSWADSYQAAPHDAKDYRETFPQLTLAWAEVLRGNSEGALSRLGQLAELAQTDGRIDCLIKVLACTALAQGELRRIEVAQSTLKWAIGLAAPEGYCRTFVDFGPLMRGMLQNLITNSHEQEFVRSLLAAFPPEAKEASSMPLAERLTDREFEVLKLLAAGLSNQEIADELVLALGTVKQYNHIIFRKLEVRTRIDAANRARELSLL